MNKQTFIEELKKGLAARGVADVGDIVADYEEHFANRLADGYTEQETVKKLGDPRALALEFAPEGEAPLKRAGFFGALGLILLELAVVPLFITAFAWALGIGAGAFGCAIAGVCLVASPAFPLGALGIPYLPRVPQAMLGVALTALGLLLLVLAAYSFLLAAKTMKAYFRWQKSALSGKKAPPRAVFPLAGNRGKRALRRVTVVSFVLLAAMLTAAYALMSVMAGNPEFWHVWGWFGYVK